ncbi:MAG: hypothetical protein SV775_17810, partial [Thermodesulfobacteriota bacterium]|nr:hypothetical protein [Thermodesulfobacteriota bacterium]
MKTKVKLFELTIILVCLCFLSGEAMPCSGSNPTPPPEIDPDVKVAVSTALGGDPQTAQTGQNGSTLISSDPVSTGGGEFRYSR